MKVYIIEFSKGKYNAEITACKQAAEDRKAYLREFLDEQGETHITMSIRAVELKTQGKNFYSIARQTNL